MIDIAKKPDLNSILFAGLFAGLILTSCANGTATASDEDEPSKGQSEAIWRGEGSGCPRELFYPALNYQLYRQECYTIEVAREDVIQSQVFEEGLFELLLKNVYWSEAQDLCPQIALLMPASAAHSAEARQAQGKTKYAMLDQIITENEDSSKRFFLNIYVENESAFHSSHSAATRNELTPQYESTCRARFQIGAGDQNYLGGSITERPSGMPGESKLHRQTEKQSM